MPGFSWNGYEYHYVSINSHCCNPLIGDSIKVNVVYYMLFTFLMPSDLSSLESIMLQISLFEE